MSEQGVIALLDRLQTDQGFLERLEAAPTPEAKRQLVRDAGFDIGPSDLPFVRAQAGQQELSDEDLEKVAGGTGTWTTNILATAGAGLGSAAAGIGVMAAAALA